MPHRALCSRRAALQALAAGTGASFVSTAVSAQNDDRKRTTTRPIVGSAKAPHAQPRAKHVIVLYMSGGFSHVDTFDPKPRLTRDHDKPIGSPAEAAPQQVKNGRYLKGSNWKFRPNRECGTEVSDLFPHIREVMHEAALIRSLHSDHRDHGEATLQLHTGSTNVPMPSLGAWLSYGLGTENPQLPGHVVISEHRPYNGPMIWDSNFLPAIHSGVQVMPGDKPLPYLKPDSPAELQNLELDLLASLNQKHLEKRARDARLIGRRDSFRTAKGLQDLAPQVLDVTKESKQTLDLYGAKAGDRSSYAAQCIMARRLIESGVRFVEIVDAVGACRDNWDAAHRDIGSHAKYAKRVDQPIAALIHDLKQRGLFDDVLLVFCTEFGRSPWAQDGKGTKSRNHHPDAFSGWLAGGGVKGGIVYGSTDDIGNHIEENAVHVHDFHATILHLLGLDHERLTYRHAGRDFRLTDVHGRIINDIIA